MRKNKTKYSSHIIAFLLILFLSACTPLQHKEIPTKQQKNIKQKNIKQNDKPEKKVESISESEIYEYIQKGDFYSNLEFSTSFKKDTIGCLLPLSGKYAMFGQMVLSGIQLAIQNLSKKYSQQFKIIVKDTRANPLQTKLAIEELDKQGVSGIIGPLLTVDVAGDKASELKIPMIALTQRIDFPLKSSYLFSNFINPQMQIKTLGAYLFSKLGVKKAAILYPDEKYGKKYMQLFWDQADEYGAKIVGVESYDNKATDFSKPIKKLSGEFFVIPEDIKLDILNESENNLKSDEQLLDVQVSDKDILENNESFFLTTDIKNENNSEDIKDETIDEIEDNSEDEEEEIQIDFQALFLPDSPLRIKLILPQLVFHDVTDIYLVGTNLWHNQSLLKDTKGYNKNSIITDGFFGNSKTPITAEFTKKFKSLFKREPQFLDAIGYDTASIMFLTAMEEKVNSRQELKDLLKSGHRIFEGVTGNTIFDNEGIAHRKLFLITMKKKKFVEINR